ncbi:hypothetical protein [Rhizobium sp. H4]|uniref:hypothetical protein n=1 Tax=Rhizobium sp. H4 TaxID=2035449 RepID=UPI00131B5EDC|nr:hypothetical protein [Rhizobium sp. H4]
MTGRHYLPVEFAKPVAEALGIAQGELIYSILLQYFPKVGVDAIWEAIATHIFAQQESGEEGLDERREKQKKKRTKSR